MGCFFLLIGCNDYDDYLRERILVRVCSTGNHFIFSYKNEYFLETGLYSTTFHIKVKNEIVCDINNIVK
jgi:hypothetical protein